MAQIVEDYCSFELSKLLKEKGFDGVCRAGYTLHGSLNVLEVKEYLTNQICSDTYWGCIAPTLQMAMKWLREVHGLFISIEPCFDYELKHVVYLAFIQNVTDIDIFKEGRVEVASGYIVEAVYSKALKYCLEHLI